MSRKEDLRNKKWRHRSINYLRRLCHNCTIVDSDGKPIIKPFRYRFRNSKKAQRMQRGGKRGDNIQTHARCH